MSTLSRLTTIAAILTAGSLMAQENVGTITGTLKDKAGKPLSGAILKLASPKLLGDRNATSGPDGSFRFALLLPGEYSLIASAKNHISSKAIIHVTAGGIIRQELVLQPIVVQDAVVEVISTAESAAIDKAETKTSTTLAVETLQTLPLGMTAYAAVQLAPGTAGDSNYTQVRGGLAGKAAYLVNGISVRDSRRGEGRSDEVTLDDLTEEVSVIQSPLNAKYGNSSSGVVALTTKTGSNTFTGSLRIKMSREDWSALFPASINPLGQTLVNPSTVASDEVKRTYEITLTGPIVKDLVTFTYGARLKPTITQNSSVYNPLVTAYGPFAGAYSPGPNGTLVAGRAPLFGSTATQAAQAYGNTTNNYYFFKLFFQLGTNHQVELNYDYHHPVYYDAQGLSVDPNANHYQASTDIFQTINYRGLIGSNQILDIRYGVKKVEVDFGGGPESPFTTRYYASPENTSYAFNPAVGPWAPNSGLSYTLFGRPVSDGMELRENHTLGLNYNLLLNQGAGYHSIDLGFSRDQEICGYPKPMPNNRRFYGPGVDDKFNFLVYNYVGSIADPKRPGLTAAQVQNAIGYSGSVAAPSVNAPCMLSYFGGSSANVVKTIDTVYANDSWNLNDHWILMGGLRIDKHKDEDGMGLRYSSTMVSPRFEVKYDVNGDNKRVFSLSFARFVGMVQEYDFTNWSYRQGANMMLSFWNQGAPQGNAALPAFYFVNKAEIMNPANYGKVYDYSRVDGMYTLNDKLKPEYSDELAVSMRRNYGSGAYMSAQAYYRQYKGMLASTAIIDKTIQVKAPVAGLSDLPNYERHMDNDSDRVRKMMSLETQWSAPLYQSPRSRLTFAGNYTYQRCLDQDQSGYNYSDYLAAKGVPKSVYNPYGEVMRNHTLKTWLTYGFKAGSIQSDVSLLARFFSGAPQNIYNQANIPGRFDAGFGGPTQAPTLYYTYYNGRGAYTYPGGTRYDFQYNITVPLARKVRVFSNLTVSNVFNTIRPTDYGRTPAQLGANQWGTHAYTEAYRAGGMINFGVPTVWDGARSFSLDMGIKF